MNVTEHTKIRDWYVQAYPTDDLGLEIDSHITFLDVFDALDHYQDVYQTIGVGDSVIRERVFAQLAKIMGTPYEYVFNQWLLCA